MNLLFRNADSFAARSKSLLSVFNKTLSGLEKLNNQMMDTKTEILTKIVEEQKEADRIEKTIQSNTKIINKITNLIKDDEN